MPDIKDIATMSDEELLSFSGPVETTTEEPTGEDSEDEASTDDLDVEHPENEDVSSSGSEDEAQDKAEDAGEQEEEATAKEGIEAEVEADPEKDKVATEEKDDKSKTEEKVEDKQDKDPKPEAKTDEAVVEVTGEQALDFYKQMMTPFRANGKMIELKNPEEAVSLMKMGANYTRKMQELQPHRRVLTMLENNNLLDANKLSFLIDLDKKDPNAIKKLVKESGIDPMDIDTTAEPEYVAGSHNVTDEEVRFKTVLDDLNSTETGRETIKLLGDWDQDSKQAIWAEPQLMEVMNQQREIGVYDLIVGEMERQKMLNKLPANTPFLQAYKQIGDELHESGAFNSIIPKEQDKVVNEQKKVETPAPKVEITTRVSTPKPTVENSDKAKAASLTRTPPKSTNTSFNPLANMPDDQFLASFDGRL